MPAWNGYKRPDELIRLGIDWTQELDGATITAHNFRIADDDTSGVTLSNSSATDTMTIVWVGGGIAGHVALIEASVTTSIGEELSTKMRLPIAP